MENIEGLKISGIGDGTVAVQSDEETKFVEVATKRLAAKEELIRKDLMELLSRLEPILKLEQPVGPVGIEDNVPTMSQHAIQLYQIGDGLHDAHLVISDILERLDL